MSDADVDADVDSEARYDDKDDSEHPLVNTAKAQCPQRRTRRKNRFKRKRKLAQCFLIALVGLITLGVTAALVYTFKTTTFGSDNHEKSPIHSKKFVPPSRVRSILLWNADGNWGLRYRTTMTSALNCSNNCQIDLGSLTRPLEQYDAVVFTPNVNMTSIVLQHSFFNQVLVYANKATLLDTALTANFSKIPFHLTLTYRTDSDIVWSDFEVRDRNGLRIAPALSPKWESFYHFNRTHHNDLFSLMGIVESRTNFATIRICDNNTIAASFYDELKNYILPPAVIDVDYSCGISEAQTMSSIGKYKFFLAFEDNLCTDKISKLFYAALQNKVIPVVLGGPIAYSNFAPPHSYIMGYVFTSIRELAEYLVHLDDNPTEYIKYLWWTHLYTIGSAHSPFCKLCEKLQNTSEWNSQRSQKNNASWWNSIHCYNTTPFFSF